MVGDAVAEAPRNTARGVQSLKELEKDIKFALPSSAVSVGRWVLVVLTFRWKTVHRSPVPRS